jgi:hypothetical protein
VLFGSLGLDNIDNSGILLTHMNKNNAYLLNSPTRAQLSHLLFEGLEQFGGAVKIKGVVFTIISAVEREDGSGINYNVSGYNVDGHEAKVFVRCVD